VAFGRETGFHHANQVNPVNDVHLIVWPVIGDGTYNSDLIPHNVTGKRFMTIVRSGTTDKYSENWARAFGSAGPDKKRAKSKPSAVSRSAKADQLAAKLVARARAEAAAKKAKKPVKKKG
jgi:hypothetical protein